MSKKYRLSCRERAGAIGGYAIPELAKKGSFVMLSGRLGTGFNAGRRYRAASLIKVPLAIALMDGVEKGVLSLDEMLTVTPENRVRAKADKGGDVDHARAGTKFTVDDVLYQALANSDNSAANMLMDYAGMDNVNRLIEKYGAKDTVLARKMCDRRAVKEGKENYTTPMEMANIFESLRRFEVIPPRYCRKLLSMMAKNRFNGKLTRDLPEGMEVPRKGGVLRPRRGEPGVVHDVGIVPVPNRPYTIGVFTEGVETDEAKDIIARVSKHAYGVMRA